MILYRYTHIRVSRFIALDRKELLLVIIHLADNSL
jgi:hypothetical protein